ncbi:MAG: hypothetical protein ACJ790_19550 [Myxococcaceae bacterium]
MAPAETAAPYSILFSTQAWHATGVLSRDQFGRLNRLLGSLADLASNTDAPEGMPGLISLEVSGVRAKYTFDHDERVLHVVDLSSHPTLEMPVIAVR